MVQYRIDRLQGKDVDAAHFIHSVGAVNIFSLRQLAAMLTMTTPAPKCRANSAFGTNMAKSQEVNDRPYHHGDLRRAIVIAALEILKETQSLEFSLRELARRAGVSHNAPYKHFADKRELLAAVSTAGFELLTKRMSNDVASISNARARLFAMLRAYIHHGVENPALYRLMFGGYLTGPDSDRPAIERAAAEQT
jgi:AcrR family transcriptional regulator